MKKKILKYFELVSIIVISTIIWYLAANLFSDSRSNNWTGLTLAMAFLFIAWSLGSIIIRDNKIFLGITFFSLLTQLIFSRNFKSLPIILISLLLLWIARKLIRREIKMRLKVDIWNYLRVGRRFFIFALALMLTGQYYFSNDAQIASETLPKLKFNHKQESFLSKIVSFVDPSLIKENKEAVTVDEFIIDKFNNDPLASKRFGAEIDFSSINYNQQEVILAGGREDVSKMVERKVSGDEKMIDIFLEIINNKIDDVLNVNVGYMDKNMPVAHLIFTVGIFLAIVGSGMLASVILIFVVAFIFRMLIAFNLLTIDKKAVNMEIIKIS